jgi:hypothetical protein
MLPWLWIERSYMNTRFLLWTTALSALSCGLGCNTWIDYPEEYTPAAAPAPAPVTIDLDFPPVTALNHFGFAAIIERYSRVSDDRVMVDYDGFAADGEAQFFLNQYVGLVGTLNPSDLAGKNERLAFWLNAYDAVVVRGIIQQACLALSDPAEPESARAPKPDGCDHSFSTFAGSFFDVAYPFAGQALTLNQVENGVLRGDRDHESLEMLSAETVAAIDLWHQELWGGETPDARIHAGLNCGVVGCPDLHVYVGPTIDEELDAVTRRWLDNPGKGAGPNGISRIFEWFKADFDASHGGVEAFITAFRTNGLDGVDMDRFLVYDDRLNSIENP